MAATPKEAPWCGPSAIVVRVQSRKPERCGGRGRPTPLATMRCWRHINHHGRCAYVSVAGHRLERYLDALHLRGGQREIDILRRSVPVAIAKPLGGLESFGGLRDAAERC